jgi:hypothetical protein
VTFNEQGFPEETAGAQADISRLFSKVIVVAPLDVGVDTLSQMVGLPDANGASTINLTLWNGVIAAAAGIVNLFLTAFCEAHESVDGVVPVTHIGPREVLAWYRTIVVAATPDLAPLSPGLLKSLFSHTQFGFRIVGRYSDVRSDVEADLDKINLISRHSASYSFYETSMRARYHADVGEYELALILVCVAFEAVHAAVVKRFMACRIPKGSDSLSEQIIRDLGIKSLLGITPYLVLKRARRPTVDQLRRCESAIRYRNAIVHSLVGRDGRPKTRSYTSEQLKRAYEDVREIYRAYLEELHAGLQ